MNLEAVTILRAPGQAAAYGSRELADALGLSQIAFGSILAEGYVTHSVKRTGPGRPRRFTFVDAHQLAIFFRLYRHWGRSVVTLGWLVDGMLERDRIDFAAWPHSPVPGKRPVGVPSRSVVVDQIERLTAHPHLMPVWRRHRDRATPFHVFVTATALEITQSPDILRKDGLLVNLTRTLDELEQALSGKHSTRCHGRAEPG